MMSQYVVGDEAFTLKRTCGDDTPTTYDQSGDAVASAAVICLLMLAVVALLAASPTHGQSYTLTQTFNDPTPTNGNEFGFSVALDGGRVLVGARGGGQAYLFDAATGNLQQTFDNPTQTLHNEFGFSVALDGDYVLIGVPRESDNGFFVGQAHLFDAATGNLLQTFNDPIPTNQDEFGISVALDGGRVLIGARNDGTQGANIGQAHLFDASTGGLLHTFDDPTPSSADQFGRAVALEGNHVLVGAWNDDTKGAGVGQAHLFDAGTGNLLQTFDDPTPTIGDIFGFSVALEGGRVLIGAPSPIDNNIAGHAYLFDAATGNLLQSFDDPTPTSVDRFGFSVALEGNNVLIGARTDDTNGTDVGQAHLFDATTGSLLQTFDDPTVTTTDEFGFSVALEGNNVLIGARVDRTNGFQVGQAHLFTIPEPTTLSLLALGGVGLLGRHRYG